LPNEDKEIIEGNRLKRTDACYIAISSGRITKRSIIFFIPVLIDRKIIREPFKSRSRWLPFLTTTLLLLLP
jgi:hypothetical protein